MLVSISMLEVKDMHVSVDGKNIVKGVNLSIGQGEIHALMGPNGSGKSSLAFAIMGHPRYKVEEGDVIIDGKSILNLSVEKRAKLGLFLGMQYPVEVAGLSYVTFLKAAYSALKEKITIMEFKEILEEQLKAVKLPPEFVNRNLNEGFSGGERKIAEILQLKILQPRFAVLDEADSGLDIDALKNVAKAMKEIASQNTGLLVITHYQRILNYLHPDFVHVMVGGKIVKSGDEKLAKELEEKGYEGWVNS